MPQISPRIDPALLVGGGEAHCPLISLNTRTPFHQNKRIHPRTTIVGSPWLWFTDLHCRKRKTRRSRKQKHISGGDVMRGAELIPEKSVILHGLIIKWWFLWVKKKGGEDNKAYRICLQLGFYLFK